jgi:hypothetical protein
LVVDLDQDEVVARVSLASLQLLSSQLQLLLLCGGERRLLFRKRLGRLVQLTYSARGVAFRHVSNFRAAHILPRRRQRVSIIVVLLFD